MPIYRDTDSEEGTFGPSMSAAMSLHKNKKHGKKEEGEGKDKVAHHIEQAKHHIDAAHAAHSGAGMEDEEMPGQGGGLSGLLGGEDEE
jgi:hypothetical protein